MSNQPKKGFELVEYINVVIKNLRLCRTYLNGDFDGLMLNVSPTRDGRKYYLETLRELQTAVESVETCIRNVHLLYEVEC